MTEQSFRPMLHRLRAFTVVSFNGNPISNKAVLDFLPAQLTYFNSKFPPFNTN